MTAQGILYNHLNKAYGKLALIFLPFLAGLMTVSICQSAVIKGKVTSVQGKAIESDIGSEKGVKIGDSGRVYYVVQIEGKEKPIYVAKFKITHLSDKSSVGQVEEKTTDLRPGYFVEISSVMEGELEIKSEPSGARVFVDGKESGKTPLVVSRMKPGQHQIRVVHEGYELYEEKVRMSEGERKQIHFPLKKAVGSLVVRTEPLGASISIDGKPVGAGPYEGKDLSPGPIKVRVTKEGYEPWEKNVMVESGKRLEVLASMKEKKVEVPPPSLTPPPPPAAKPFVTKEKEAKPEESRKTSKEADLNKMTSDAPVWKAGNKWHYRNPGRGDTWAFEVVEVKKNEYILKVTGRKELLAHDKKTMNVVYLIGTDNKETKVTDNPFEFLNFPFFVGKKWVLRTKEGSSDLLTEYQVEGVEEVQTLAGRLMAFRIKLEQTNLGSKMTGWVRYWYSPEVGHRVKQEIDKSGYWARMTRIVDFELVSYELK